MTLTFNYFNIVGVLYGRKNIYILVENGRFER
jgi:hypothetical protein